MSTRQLTIEIPAAWAGLLRFGHLAQTESGRWVDGLGREALLGSAEQLGDGRAHLHDDRRVTVVDGDVTVVMALEVRHDLADDDGDAGLPYGLWVEAHRDGNEMELVGDLDALSPFRYRDATGDVVIDTKLVWSPHLRSAAIDACKRIWQVTKPVAARLVDTGRGSVLGADAKGAKTSPQGVIGGIACGHQVIDAVVPFVHDELLALLPDGHVRVIWPERMTLMASVRLPDGHRISGMWTPHDWSQIVIGGQVVDTGMPVGGGPDPRRLARVTTKLLVAHPERFKGAVDGMAVDQFAAVTPWS
jgi:hypothetical protein